MVRKAGGTNSFKGGIGILGPKAKKIGWRLRWSVRHGCGTVPILALTASNKGIGDLRGLI